MPPPPFCTDPEHPCMADGATVGISPQPPNSGLNVVRPCQKQLTGRMRNRQRQRSKMCRQPCCIRLQLFVVFLLATLTQNKTPKPTYLGFNFIETEIFLARGIRALAASTICSDDGYRSAVRLATFPRFCPNNVCQQRWLSVYTSSNVTASFLPLPPNLA